MARLVVDLRGRRFGRLVIAQDARSSTRKRKAYWPCVCECGRKKRVRGAADGCSLSRGARGIGDAQRRVRADGCAPHIRHRLHRLHRAGEAFIGTFWHTPLRVQGKRFPNCDQTVERLAACAKMSPISATFKKTSCLPTGIPEAAACNSSRGPLAALRSTK